MTAPKLLSMVLVAASGVSAWAETDISSVSVGCQSADRGASVRVLIQDTDPPEPTFAFVIVRPSRGRGVERSETYSVRARSLRGEGAIYEGSRFRLQIGPENTRSDDAYSYDGLLSVPGIGHGLRVRCYIAR